MVSLEQKLAFNLWRWNQGDGNDKLLADSFCEWVARSNSVVPITSDELVRGLLRIRQRDNFEQQQGWLSQRWLELELDGSGMPSKSSAVTYIKDWLDRQDHGLVYNRPIISGLSSIEADTAALEGFEFTGHYYEPRAYWIMHVTLEGKAIYSVDQEVLGEQGDVILIAPNASCHFRRHPQVSLWLHSWTLFQPQTSLHPWMQWPEVAAGVYKVNAAKLLLDIEALMTAIRENPSDRPYSSELSFNLLEQTLIRIEQTRPDASEIHRDPRVEKALSYLRERISEPVKMEEVASHCHLSLSRLSHIFKQDLGISLQDYRNNLRMQEARRLLATTSLEIQRISEALAYPNAEQLSKAFMKHQGCSPREFRRQISSNPENN